MQSYNYMERTVLKSKNLVRYRFENIFVIEIIM